MKLLYHATRESVAFFQPVNVAFYLQKQEDAEAAGIGLAHHGRGLNVEVSHGEGADPTWVLVLGGAWGKDHHIIHALYH